MSEQAPSPDVRVQKSRAFLINVMMTFFISVSVFVVGTYFFVIPYLFNHEQQLNDVRAWAAEHQSFHDEATAEAAPAAAAPAPAEGAAAPPAGPAAPAEPAAAPAAPAVAPAAAPAAAP